MKYRIGSFNMKNMGFGTKKNFLKLAEIIRSEKLDVVSLQEILSEGKALNDFISHSLPGWESSWQEPGESKDPEKSKDKRGEGYAFLWNPKRLKLADSVTLFGKREFAPRIVNSQGRDVSGSVSKFARAPYYARFIPVHGGFFELRLINIHLHFGDNSKAEIEKRKEEFELLVNRVYPDISLKRRYGNNRVAYTIAMGDYNLNLFRPRGEAEKRIDKNTYIPDVVEVNGQRILTVQDALTTLKSKGSEGESSRGYSNNYDHFTFDVMAMEEDGIAVKYRRIDAVRKYYNDDFDSYRCEISDHVPIVLELCFGTE